MRQRWNGILAALLAAAIGGAWAAWAGLIPGGGPQRSDCLVELLVERVDVPGPQVKNGRIVECTDGDACDADATCNDQCVFRVAVCVNQHDPNLACTPPAALRRLMANKLPTPAFPATMEGSACGSFVDLPPVKVKVKRDGRKQPGMLALSANATAEKGSSPARDRDKYVLKCLPSSACLSGAPTTTTTTLPGGTTRTVTVGPGGAFGFDPQRITIRVGETVRWRWDSSGHNVVSGSGGAADGRFCSPNDRACGGTPTSNAGATYEHTFTEAGTFPYFCQPHSTFGMTGQVIVE